MNSPKLPPTNPKAMLWQEPSSHGCYGQDVCYGTPGLLVVLVDQSRQTATIVAGASTTIAAEVFTSVNACLQDIVISRTLCQGFHDGLHVVVLGYRSDEYGRAIVQPALIGPLAGREFVSISDLAKHPARIDENMALWPDDETGEMIEMTQHIPGWIDPVATGESPLCAALAEACRIVDEWIPRFPQSFPPIVWNITSGVFSDGNPWPYADALKRRGTHDGRVLLFQTYLTLTYLGPGGTWSPFAFPNTATPMPDAAAKTLFATASVLPPRLRQQQLDRCQDISESARCLCYNCDGPFSYVFRDAFDWDKSPFLSGAS